MIFTVGHSTRTAEEFLDVVRGVALVVDVRSYPGSRRNPQFGRDEMPRWTDAAGVGYVHAPLLGGRRRPTGSDANAAWRVEGFRAYADHMSTPEFAEGLAELELLAADRDVAVMCSEALWWRCHRRLLADALLARGWQVAHLPGRRHHVLPPIAVVDGVSVTYPGGTDA